MIRSFRLRLTLWYLAFFSLLFLLFSLFLNGVLARAWNAGWTNRSRWRPTPPRRCSRTSSWR